MRLCQHLRHAVRKPPNSNIRAPDKIQVHGGQTWMLKYLNFSDACWLEFGRSSSLLFPFYFLIVNSPCGRVSISTTNTRE